MKRLLSKAEMQEVIIEKRKQTKSMESTIATLEADLKYALSQTINPDQRNNSQFWRRTYIRSLLALVEALLWHLRQIAPLTAHQLGIELSQTELDKLSEIVRKAMEDGTEDVRRKYLQFQDSLKTSFKLFAKAHGFEFQLKCNDIG